MGGCRPYGLAAAGHARKRRPCRLLPPRVAPASLVGYCPCEWCRPPLRAGPGRSWLPPCRGPWPWPGHGWPALHAGWPPLHLAAFAVKM
ncbi:hypothetical protein B296_00053934 [Ensete ventricosum]|uniref:Uncharacterized protein n=1 Tax=Ensete ventricosum TaxID=4639 RepID=A0A426WZI0_ENSVE|nr:hypothetical protein B296_00053934 [Ensete ventricosum]